MRVRLSAALLSVALLSVALLSVPLLALSSPAFAQSAPVGKWTTIDDKTRKPKSIVEIYEAKDGSLSGRVDRVLSTDRGANPVCDTCSGSNKGKPVQWMVIMWGVRKSGDGWEGGRILDPATGTIASVKVQSIAAGQKLEVRGCMGFSMLGRTQTWMRL